MKARDANPLPYAGCYTLDVYCDRQKSGHTFADGSQRAPFMGSFTGRTHGECARIARQMGWKIHKDRTATCPRCLGTKVDKS